MKKIVFLMAALVLFILPIRGNAAEYDYAKISDDSTIEEDFILLQLNITEYYSLPTKYEKWYVVGMAESYLEDYNKIQTYFYLYNPTKYGFGADYLSTVSDFNLTATANGVKQLCSGMKLDYNQEHCLYKVKGFTYDFVATAKIRVSKIQHHNMQGLGITSDSNFFATVNHSKLNGFNVELSFNSTLLLEEYEAVSIQIPKNSSIFEDFKDMFSSEYYAPTNMVFYNFNFPNNIKPDKILKAVFNYDFVTYDDATPGGGEVVSKREEIRPQINSYGEYNEEDLGVYTPGTFKYKASGGSTELSFETFVLGNRVTKGEFGYVDMTGLESKFNYDASVFLGTTSLYEFKTIFQEVKRKVYTRFENIEFIELSYEKDGIVYRCQVVSKPIDEPEPETPNKKPDLWDKVKEFLIKVADFFIENILNLSSSLMPDAAKVIIGFFILFIVLVVLIFVLKLLITIIKIPFSLLK